MTFNLSGWGLGTRPGEVDEFQTLTKGAVGSLSLPTLASSSRPTSYYSEKRLGTREGDCVTLQCLAGNVDIGTSLPIQKLCSS